MSTAAKKRNADRRREEKRKRKLANAARYQAMIGTAGNVKRKAGASQPGKKTPGHPHISGECGNIGCRRCFPTVGR